MAKIFIGGSRSINFLPESFKNRLNNIVDRQHHVMVGDAEGADLAIQAYLKAIGSNLVTVCYSGKSARFNREHWPVYRVDATGLSGYSFHAAKDRAMAEWADFGLMLWDGSSSGSLLNILRLTSLNKPSVLFNQKLDQTFEIRSGKDWLDLLGLLDSSHNRKIKARATGAEWIEDKPLQQNLGI